MKIKVLTFLLLISTGLFAQRAKVTSAYNYNKYGELDKAQQAIDEAVVDESTKDFWKAWYFRGDIYAALARTQEEKFKGLAEAPVKTAYESYKKVYTLDDSRKLDKNELNQKYKALYPMAFNKGIELYKGKEYLDAREYFEICYDINSHFDQLDTLSMYNIALTSDLAGKNEKAIEYYEKCIEQGYRGAQTVAELANLLLKMDKEEEALDVLKKGRKDYPKSQALVTTELNIYLQNEKFDEALENLNTAIENDPDNGMFYYARGTIYNNKGNTEMAEKDYLKAIEKDSANFDAYYNLGALYYNQGAEKINACNEIMENEKYEECKKQADQIFDNALPYLEKAHELNPEDKNTMVSLKQLYARTGATKKYEAITKKMGQ